MRKEIDDGMPKLQSNAGADAQLPERTGKYVLKRRAKELREMK
jgi:hypothetical protein